MDRFIPNLKMYYSPFQITEEDASFQWVLGSHKINEEYINHWKNSKIIMKLKIKKIVNI